MVYARIINIVGHRQLQEVPLLAVAANIALALLWRVAADKATPIADAVAKLTLASLKDFSNQFLQWNIDLRDFSRRL